MTGRSLEEQLIERGPGGLEKKLLRLDLAEDGEKKAQRLRERRLRLSLSLAFFQSVTRAFLLPSGNPFAWRSPLDTGVLSFCVSLSLSFCLGISPLSLSPPVSPSPGESLGLSPCLPTDEN